MSNFARIAIAAAAVLAVAVVGIKVLPGGSQVGGPGPSPTPTPSPIPLPTGSLAPATTYTVSDPGSIAGSRLTWTVPAAGWLSIDATGIIEKHDLAGQGSVLDVAISTWMIDNVYTDACHWNGTALAPPVGPTAADLAKALVAEPRSGASPPTDVTVGGYPAKRLELSAPAGLDLTTCDRGGQLGRWFWSGDPSNGVPYTYGAGQRNVVYIVDVAGKRQVIDTMYLPGTSAKDLAELQAVVDSIVITP